MSSKKSKDVKASESSYHEKRVYTVDHDFRPSGRVFLKAQNPAPVPERKSSLKMLVPSKASPIDDKNVSFQHEVHHEKHVEAVVTDYGSPYDQFRSGDFQSLPAIENGTSSQQLVQHNGIQEITRNKRTSTDVLGSNYETTKRTASTEGSRGRVQTQIVRRVTTISRAEEQAMPNNMIKCTKDTKTTELGFIAGSVQAKRQKVGMVFTIIDFSEEYCLQFRIWFEF